MLYGDHTPGPFPSRIRKGPWMVEEVTVRTELGLAMGMLCVREPAENLELPGSLTMVKLETRKGSEYR